MTTKEFFDNRNYAILKMKYSGKSNIRIGIEFGLSASSVKRIIRETKKHEIAK